MIKIPAYTLAAALLAQPLFGAIIFDGTTATIAGWDHNGPGYGQIADPLDAGNQVLDVSGRGGNHVAGEAIPAIDNTSTGILSFDFYLQNSTSADVAVSLTETSNLSGISGSDAAFIGPYLRVVDGKISFYEGNGSGSGGSFVDADQAIATATWYTITMTVDNAADTWSGTIAGGAYGSATTLTASSDDTFGFRFGGGGDLVNFAFRANSNNGSPGPLFDNIDVSVVPEPSTYALMGGVLAMGLVLLRRRSRR